MDQTFKSFLIDTTLILTSLASIAAAALIWGGV